VTREGINGTESEDQPAWVTSANRILRGGISSNRDCPRQRSEVVGIHDQVGVLAPEPWRSRALVDADDDHQVGPIQAG